MTDWITRLLDLDRIAWGDPNVVFSFERPLAPWGWAGVAIAAVALALWSYRRLVGPAWVRLALASLRALLLATLVVLIAGPRLVQRDERVEKDWVLVLLDRSASMTIPDAPAETAGARETRERQLRDAIEQSWPQWREIAGSRILVWLGFDAGAYELAHASDTTGPDETLTTDAPPQLGVPDGRRTNLAAALDQALRRAAARPVSAVVIFSDGRSIAEPSRAAIRQLQAERIPVHVVPLGSDGAVGDLAIAAARGPGVAFVDDVAPVQVELERLGAGDFTGVVRMTDAATGLLLDEQRIDSDKPAETITLTHTPTETESADALWIVELIPDTPDLVATNNRATVPIRLVDRPLRALYIDGRPRWEARYLKNLLLREKSITSSNLLLAPDRRYTQESDVEIAQLPGSVEEWAEYDAVILGDVVPAVFTKKQLEDLREHIAIRGAGLLWIGGEQATPDAWWDTPLADLLPFTHAAGEIAPSTDPVLMSPTPLAQSLGVLRLALDNADAWPAQLTNPDAGWSALRWWQRIKPESLKPATEVLAWLSSVANPNDAAPGALLMRFGAGRIAYIPTDEIWRWRYGRGEALPERFWIQIIRLLGREGLARAGQSAILTATPDSAEVEQPVRIQLELVDQALVDLDLGAVVVTITRKPEPGDDEAPTPTELTLRADSADSRTFATIWTPNEPGDWTIHTAESAINTLGLEESIKVALPDDETRHPETDHELLARISEQTEGRVLAISDLADLPQALPNRQTRIVHEIAEPLWDTPLALILVITLLTLEWMGRRLIRLI
ncbi:MAG: hypothetical protein H6813_04270 [Phycisphaeraceae bacterium]|nr:hypothetical protein [Phycisphaeraceae bacterium]MCB9847163.1 hypothetical protein [Phycisphaeraceae bacterium]